MSQMVLPQSPAPGQKADAGAQKASTPEKSGDSHYDSVSRAEQKRMDRKQADQKQESRQTQQAQDPKQADRQESADNQSRAENSRARRSEETGSSTTATREGELEGQEVSQTGEVVDPTEESVELTFAGLQALFMPAGTAGSSAAGAASGMAISAGGSRSGGTLPMQGIQGLVNGLSGMTMGKTAEGTVGSTALSQGVALAEVLSANLSADGGRPSDPSTLLGATRFQSALDVAGQQGVNAATAKLPNEVMALRGYTTSIDVPVGHAEWGDKLVGKLTWLTARNMSVAEIHLSPPDMGPMDVRVQVQQDQANITVHAANPAVRDQLELHSHRLRDMLNEQGLSLEQFDVSDSPQQQAGEQDADGDGTGQGQSGLLADGHESGAEIQTGDLDLTWKGEVDIFA